MLTGFCLAHGMGKDPQQIVEHATEAQLGSEFVFNYGQNYAALGAPILHEQELSNSGLNKAPLWRPCQIQGCTLAAFEQADFCFAHITNVAYVGTAEQMD